MKDFENYKLLHNFMHPDSPLKGWINESNYTNYFKEDWNTLMEVVDKIESITVDEDNSFNVTIGATNYCVIQDSNGELYESVENYGVSKLITTYNACVEFVKWFNNYK